MSSKADAASTSKNGRDAAVDDVATAEIAAKTAALGELYRAAHWMLGAERRLRPRHRASSFEGFTVLQTVTLIALESRGTATMGELAGYANVNPATVTGMLDEPEMAELVVREKSKTDRRVMIVSLTARGKKLAAEQRQRWEAWWHDAFDDVSERDIRVAAESIERIAGIMEAIGNNEPVPERPGGVVPRESFDHVGQRRPLRPPGKS